MFENFVRMFQFFPGLFFEEAGKAGVMMHIAPIRHRQIILAGEQFVVGLLFERGDDLGGGNGHV